LAGKKKEEKEKGFRKGSPPVKIRKILGGEGGEKMKVFQRKKKKKGKNVNQNAFAGGEREGGKNRGAKCQKGNEKNKKARTQKRRGA